MVGEFMRVRFFGTRGSIPIPGPRTVRYGGNTSCVEVTSESGTPGHRHGHRRIPSRPGA